MTSSHGVTLGCLASEPGLWPWERGLGRKGGVSGVLAASPAGLR